MSALEYWVSALEYLVLDPVMIADVVAQAVR